MIKTLGATIREGVGSLTKEIGHYRYLSGAFADKVQITGPYSTREAAEGFSGPALCNIETRFHFRAPKGAEVLNCDI